MNRDNPFASRLTLYGKRECGEYRRDGISERAREDKPILAKWGTVDQHDPLLMAIERGISVEWGTIPQHEQFVGVRRRRTSEEWGESSVGSRFAGNFGAEKTAFFASGDGAQIFLGFFRSALAIYPRK